MHKEPHFTVTEAARRFSDLVNRVYYRGESATLVRNGVAVARLVPPAPPGCPAAELAARWAGLPHLDPKDAAGLARDVMAGRRALPKVVARWE